MLAYLLVVVVTAAIGGQTAGLWTAVAAALSYDFFLTTPYHQLTIDSLAQVITVALLFGTSLAGRARRRVTLEAEEQAGIIRLLNGVTRAAASGENANQVAAEGIQGLLDARRVVIWRGSPNHGLVVADVADPDAPLDAAISRFSTLRAAAAGGFGRSTDRRCDGYDLTMGPSFNSSTASGPSVDSLWSSVRAIGCRRSLGGRWPPSPTCSRRPPGRPSATTSRRPPRPQVGTTKR